MKKDNNSPSVHALWGTQGTAMYKEAIAMHQEAPEVLIKCGDSLQELKTLPEKSVNNSYVELIKQRITKK